MVNALFATRDSLERHLEEIAAKLNKHLAAPAELTVDWAIDPVAAGLDGANCETIDRTRGRSSRAARLTDLKHGLWAWVAYREEWDSAPPAGRTPRFSFRTSSITLFVGFRDLLPKPQLLRLEWAGYTKQAGGFGFQGGNAGHPHWQFDALEGFLADTAEEARELASILRREAQERPPQDFVPAQVTEREVRDIVSVRRFSRLHLASCANWWSISPVHQHAPVSLQNLTNWVDHAFTYLSEELARL